MAIFYSKDNENDGNDKGAQAANGHRGSQAWRSLNRVCHFLGHAHHIFHIVTRSYLTEIRAKDRGKRTIVAHEQQRQERRPPAAMVGVMQTAAQCGQLGNKHRNGKCQAHIANPGKQQAKVRQRRRNDDHKQDKPPELAAAGASLEVKVLLLIFK